MRVAPDCGVTRSSKGWPFFLQPGSARDPDLDVLFAHELSGFESMRAIDYVAVGCNHDRIEPSIHNEMGNTRCVILLLQPAVFVDIGVGRAEPLERRRTRQVLTRD